MNRSPIRYTFCDAPFHLPVQCEHSLKHLNEQITKQDDIADHKPRLNMNNYVHAGSLSVLGLAISGYLLYSKFKKQKQNLIDVPPPPMLKASTEPKRDIFEML